MILHFFHVFKVKSKRTPLSAMFKEENFFLTAAPLDNERLHPVLSRNINYDICGKYVQTNRKQMS